MWRNQAVEVQLEIFASQEQEKKGRENAGFEINWNFSCTELAVFFVTVDFNYIPFARSSFDYAKLIFTF